VDLRRQFEVESEDGDPRHLFLYGSSFLHCE